MAPEFELRDFDPSDGEGLLAVHRTSILAISRRFYSRAELESWVQGMHSRWYAERVAAGEHLRVACVAGGPVVAFCGHQALGSRGQITRLFTAPDFQNRGVASALLRNALSDLAALRTREVHVTSSLSAVLFYERHGFDVRERIMEATLGGRDIPVRVMTRRL